MSGKWERRYYPIEEMRLEQQGDNAVMVGYAAVFNQRSEDLGGFVEEIEPGAFAESLNGDVRALWQHDVAQVLGRTKAGTLRLREDDVGLRFEVDLPQSANGIQETLRRGDVDQMSFGFGVEAQDWVLEEGQTPLRKLKKINLYEISPVTFPAYEGTSVGLRRHEIYGHLPDIPAQDEAGASADADNEQIAEQARARRAMRRRRLLLMTMEMER